MDSENLAYSLDSRLTSNFFWLFLSEVFSKGLIFIGTIYLARVLGAASFGLYSLSLSIAICVWFIADLGVSLYGAREVAKNRGKAQEFLQILNSMRFFAALILFLVLCVVIFPISIPSMTKKVIVVGALYVIAYALSSDWLLRGIEQIQYVTFGNAVLSSTFLVSVLFFVHQSQDATIAVFLHSLSYFFASSALLLVLKRKFNIRFKFKLSWNEFKIHLKELWYFAFTFALGSAIAPLVIILLGILSGQESVGFFSAPHRIIMLILGFMGIFSFSFYPILADQFVHDSESFLRTQAIFQKVMLIVGIPIGVGGFILSKGIIHLLLGNRYTPSVGVFNILVWLIPLSFMSVTYSATLLATKFQRLYLIAIGISCAVAVILSVLLIPSFGIIGAAIVLLCQKCIILILVIWMFQQHIHRFTFFDGYFIKVLGASIVMGVVIWVAKINIFGKIFVGIGLYSLILFLLKVITKEQLIRCYSLLANMRRKGFVTEYRSDL